MANGNIKQYYGIKFPFTANNDNGHFIDLCTTIEDRVASEIAHVVLTQKGTRLRKPEFGTRLVEYIFAPNDDMSWQEIEGDIKKTVESYVANVSIKKVEVIQDESNDNSIYIDIRYSVTKGNKEDNKRLVLKL